MLNIAVVAPMLSASVSTIVVANPGFFRNERRTKVIGRMSSKTPEQPRPPSLSQAEALAIR
jgi:hypothetical protein